jgi:hypothetical protein
MGNDPLEGRDGLALGPGPVDGLAEPAADEQDEGHQGPDAWAEGPSLPPSTRRRGLIHHLSLGLTRYSSVGCVER